MKNDFLASGWVWRAAVSINPTLSALPENSLQQQPATQTNPPSSETSSQSDAPVASCSNFAELLLQTVNQKSNPVQKRRRIGHGSEVPTRKAAESFENCEDEDDPSAEPLTTESGD